MILDLSRVPVPLVVENLSVNEVLDGMVGEFGQLFPQYQTAHLESDVVRKIFQVATSREIRLRQRINEAAEAVMLAYGRSTDLENLGALFGVKRLAGETDSRLRERIQKGFHQIPAGGPSGYYESLTLALSNDIHDALAVQLAPGHIQLTVLGKKESPTEQTIEPIGNTIFGPGFEITPDQSELLEKVRDFFITQQRKVFTDRLDIRAPKVDEYAIIATLFLYPGPDEAVILKEALAALKRYLNSVYKMGHDHTLSGICAALTVGGVQRVRLESPLVDVVVDEKSIAVPSLGFSIGIGGRDV